jgi:hypothetical protein
MVSFKRPNNSIEVIFFTEKAVASIEDSQTREGTS